MICDNCKKFFMAGNHPISGIPNGVKMLLNGGGSITLCASCIMSIGTMNEQEKDEFFKKLKGEKPQ